MVAEIRVLAQTLLLILIFSSHKSIVDDSFDLMTVTFQMRETEFNLIKDGLKADLVSFMEWLETSTVVGEGLS